MWSKTKLWYTNLSKASRIILWAVSAVLVGTAISASASPNPNTQTVKPPETVKTEKKSPVIEKKTSTETEAIAFTKTTVNDSNLEQGKTSLKTVGVNGVKTSTFEITYEDGAQKARNLIKTEVTTAPINEIVAVGTKIAYVKPASSCSPNYSGCVPIASDVDCAGGSGNGPAYASGPVSVIGSDIYDLDRDGDGVACE